MAWFEYYQLEPFGEEVADLRAGIVASTIANCHVDTRKRRPFSASDFIPEYGKKKLKEEVKPLTDQGDWSNVMRMATIMAQAEPRD